MDLFIEFVEILYKKNYKDINQIGEGAMGVWAIQDIDIDK